MDRDHLYWDLRDHLRHRMGNESKWYDLPQFTIDYPSLVWFHLHFKLNSKAWKHPDHNMRLCWRENAMATTHSYIAFHAGHWMTLHNRGLTMRGPPRILVHHCKNMDFHPSFATYDPASAEDFNTFKNLTLSWDTKMKAIEAGFKDAFLRAQGRLKDSAPDDAAPLFTPP